VCCGCYEVRNKFFRIHPQWPLGELLAGAFYMEQPYPLRALKQDGNGGILCTFMVVRNIIDGVLVIVQGKYYDPATILGIWPTLERLYPSLNSWCLW
jgi:hypothetical protein